MKRANRCALLVFMLLAGRTAIALADDVTLTTYLPSPDWEDYKRLQARGQFTIDDAAATAGSLQIFGNLDVWNGSVTVTGDANPIHFGRNWGPYSTAGTPIDGLRVQPAANCVSIGTNTCNPGTSKLKVFTAIRGNGLFVKPQGPEPNYLFANATWTGTPCLFASPANPDGTRRGFLGARRMIGTGPAPAVDPFAPMRLEARLIEIGDWRRADMGLPVIPCPPNPPTRFKWCSTPYTGHPDYGDTTQGILVGVDTIPNPGQEDIVPAATPLWYQNVVVLQVGDPANPMDAYFGNNIQAFPSSRAFKKDIVPLTAAEMSGYLTQAAKTDVAYYHYIGDPPDRALRIGLIAEDAPKEFSDGKSIHLFQAAAYLTASMKALKMENDALRARIEVLEAKKAALRKAR